MSGLILSGRSPRRSAARQRNETTMHLPRNLARGLTGLTSMTRPTGLARATMRTVRGTGKVVLSVTTADPRVVETLLCMGVAHDHTPKLQREQRRLMKRPLHLHLHRSHRSRGQPLPRRDRSLLQASMLPMWPSRVACKIHRRALHHYWNK